MKIIATNKKAFHDYIISEKLEVGIKLVGAEVKSVKAGSVNLKGSFVTIKEGELIAKNIHIGPYLPANLDNYDPTRNRKLLANRKEIEKLAGLADQKKLTIIPLKIYLSGSLIKLEIGLAKGKKKWDKREDIKKRDLDREQQRKS